MAQCAIHTITRSDLETSDNPRDLIRRTFRCDHDAVLMVKQLTRAGWFQRQWQCRRCGGIVQRPMAPEEKEIPVSSLPDRDESISLDWVNAETAAFDLWREIQSERRPANVRLTPEYQEYLQSWQWRERRQQVLQRDRYTCQACLAKSADEVHHLTYAHLFHEPLFDLVSICFSCHRILHQGADS